LLLVSYKSRSKKNLSGIFLWYYAHYPAHFNNFTAMKTRAIFHAQPIPESELIITPKGSIYHLDLLPGQVAENVIVVGDQYRVSAISQHFDTIEHKVSKREFVTHTGTYKGKRISVISTGIGCDNIDIVINELDALFNIDFNTRLPKEKTTSLNIVRIGTSGSLQEDIPVDSFVISSYGLGFDGLLGFYDAVYEPDELDLTRAFNSQINWPSHCNPPYFTKGSSLLIDKLKAGMTVGITATANGFYGPQGRSLRLRANVPDLNEQLNKFSYNDHRITNFEMETSALYGLSAMLGHQACTVCAIIANRFNKTYSKDYTIPVNELILTVLDRL
jgi:uridine phosphorylase